MFYQFSKKTTAKPASSLESGEPKRFVERKPGNSYEQNMELETMNMHSNTKN